MRIEIIKGVEGLTIKGWRLRNGSNETEFMLVVFKT